MNDTPDSTIREQELARLKSLHMPGLLGTTWLSYGLYTTAFDGIMWQLALSRLKVSAEEALYVGDSPLNDVAGPQSVGMKAALFPGGHVLPADIRPDWTLQDLHGVLDIVSSA